jgi:hypothetical protein
MESEVATLDLTIDDEGTIQEVSLLRYGNQVERGPEGYAPFGMKVERETTFGGCTIPSRMRGGWYGTERYAETIRFTIEEAEEAEFR